VAPVTPPTYSVIAHPVQSFTGSDMTPAFTAEVREQWGQPLM
jgi:hypothetical protein